jgi:hypothetical protein
MIGSVVVSLFGTFSLCEQVGLYVDIVDKNQTTLRSLELDLNLEAIETIFLT